MDVILDSNVFVSDYHMDGIAFKNLFDYLKRTNSALVLLRIVREEVVGKFGRELKKSWKDAAEAWEPYRLLHFPKKLPRVNKPNIEDQRRSLRKRLMKPADGVNLSYRADTSGISIDEVFIRGIKRMPPANGDGEELRDVIVWLSAIDYANSVQREVAFITNDSGFWTKEGARPEILNDIKENGGAIRLYRSIDIFVEENSPAARAADEDLAEQLIPAFRDEILSAANSAIRSYRSAWVNVQNTQVKAESFKEGKIYDLAPDIQVAELLFVIEVAFEGVSFSNLVAMSPLMGQGAVNLVNPIFAGQLMEPYSGGIGNFGGIGAVLQQSPSPNPFGWLQPATVFAQTHHHRIETAYLAKSTVRLSARILQGQVTEKEVTEFKIDKVEPVEKPASSAEGAK